MGIHSLVQTHYLAFIIIQLCFERWHIWHLQIWITREKQNLVLWGSGVLVFSRYVIFTRVRQKLDFCVS
jgi:hypothetical protein